MSRLSYQGWTARAPIGDALHSSLAQQRLVAQAPHRVAFSSQRRCVRTVLLSPTHRNNLASSSFLAARRRDLVSATPSTTEGAPHLLHDPIWDTPRALLPPAAACHLANFSSQLQSLVAADIPEAPPRSSATQTRLRRRVKSYSQNCRPSPAARQVTVVARRAVTLVHSTNGPVPTTPRRAFIVWRRARRSPLKQVSKPPEPLEPHQPSAAAAREPATGGSVSDFESHSNSVQLEQQLNIVGSHVLTPPSAENAAYADIKQAVDFFYREGCSERFRSRETDPTGVERFQLSSVAASRTGQVTCRHTVCSATTSFRNDLDADYTDHGEDFEGVYTFNEAKLDRVLREQSATAAGLNRSPNGSQQLTPAQRFLLENRDSLAERAFQYHKRKQNHFNASDDGTDGEESIGGLGSSYDTFYHDPVARPSKTHYWISSDVTPEISRESVELEQGTMPSLEEILKILEQEHVVDVQLFNLERCGRRDLGVYLMIGTCTTGIHCERVGKLIANIFRKLNIPYISDASYCWGGKEDEWVVSRCGPLVLYLFTSEMRLKYRIEDLLLAPHVSHTPEQFPSYFDGLTSMPPPYLISHLENVQQSEMQVTVKLEKLIFGDSTNQETVFSEAKTENKVRGVASANLQPPTDCDNTRSD